MQHPYLVEASISFHTNDEDKDSDSQVTVTVHEMGQTVAARINNDFGGFSDGSDHGPFYLEIMDPNATPASLRQGSVTIRIDPNGHDTWPFNWYLHLAWNNGYTMDAEANGISLTQNAREYTQGL